MATSGSKTIEALSWIDLKFSWWQNSQSIENNTTTIGWKLEAITGGGAVYVNNRTWTVTIDGTTHTGTVKVSIDKNSTQVLATGTATINHNEDGSKTFAYSFSQQFNLTLNSGKYMGTYTGNGTDTLTTIPRRSTVSVPDGVFDTAQTITIDRKSSSFTHSLKCVCNNDTFYLNEWGVSSHAEVIHSNCSILWIPPIGLAVQYPQSEFAQITYTLRTYNNGSFVGESTTTARYQVPANIRPPLSFSVSDPVWGDSVGSPIQGQSYVTVDIDTYGVYGSWIKSCSVSFDGKTYQVNEENGNFVLRTDTITGSGTIPMTVTVTDSRNRTTTADQNVEVRPYKIPRITQLYAYRCDADHLKNPKGNNVGIKFMAECSDLRSMTAVNYTIKYKRPSDELYNEIELDEYNDETLVNDGFYLIENAGDTSLEIILTVTDSFRTVSEATTAPSLEKFMSLLKKNGNIAGIAFGKVAEYECIDFDFPVKFTGGFYDSNFDYVVEQGTKNGWTYRKWNSGIGECWTRVSHTTKLNTTWGSMFVGNPSLPRQSYPFPFVSPPVENVTVQSGWYMAMPYADINGNGTNGTHASAIYNIMSLSQVTDNITVYFSISAKGKWK